VNVIRVLLRVVVLDQTCRALDPVTVRLPVLETLAQAKYMLPKPVDCSFGVSLAVRNPGSSPRRAGHEDLGWLDVDYSLEVRGIERVGNLNAQFQQGFELQWLAGDEMPERLAIQKLHHDEGLALPFVNVVDGADVRVVECRGGLCFTLEALQNLMILGQASGKNFKATNRRSFVSSALYTTPMPPPPSFSIIR
jgi:hypothetical protein